MCLHTISMTSSGPTSESVRGAGVSARTITWQKGDAATQALLELVRGGSKFLQVEAVSELINHNRLSPNKGFELVINQLNRVKDAHMTKRLVRLLAKLNHPKGDEYMLSMITSDSTYPIESILSAISSEGSPQLLGNVIQHIREMSQGKRRQRWWRGRRLAASGRGAGHGRAARGAVGPAAAGGAAATALSGARRAARQLSSSHLPPPTSEAPRLPSGAPLHPDPHSTRTPSSRPHPAPTASRQGGGHVHEPALRRRALRPLGLGG